jgi:hypothetical protein
MKKTKIMKTELEEAAHEYFKRGQLGFEKAADTERAFLRGGLYQAEKSYSEEDMLKFAWFLIENVGQYSCDRTAHFEGKYLEQFKKKA